MFKDTYNVKRVHKLSFFMTIALILALCIQGLVVGGFSVFLKFLIPSCIIFIIALINYFLPINDYVKGYLFCLIPAIVITVFFYLHGYSLNKHYMIFITITVCILYVKKELVIIHSAVLNVMLIALYILSPDKITGTDTRLESFMSILIVLNLIEVALYFSTKWGREIINESYQKQIKAEELLSKLEVTFDNVESSTGVLEENISKLNRNICTLEEESLNITKSMQEMANQYKRKLPAHMQLMNQWLIL